MNKKLIPIIATSMILASCFGNTEKGGDNDSIQSEEIMTAAEDSTVEEDAEAQPLFKSIDETEYEGHYNYEEEEWTFEETAHYQNEYNREGQLVRKNELLTSSEETYVYNSKGQLESVMSFRGGYSTECTYTYDKNGNLTKETDGETGTVVKRYEYNDKNQCVASYNYYPDDGSLLSKEVYAYDGNGLKKSMTRYVDDEAVGLEVYEYNDRGDMVEERHEQGDETIETMTYEYEYDEQGNWTTKLTTF